MENKEIAKIFKLTSKLMDLHGENEFKIKSYVNAAFRIDRLEKQITDLSPEEFDNFEGIGKGIIAKIEELNETGESKELAHLLEIIPPGIVKMMGIETMGELLYACNENRLVEVKGFGEKTQQQIRKAIEFTISNTGKFHWAALENLTNTIIAGFKSQ